MKKDQKIYIKEDGVRIRKSPETTEDAKFLSKSQELTFIDGPWVKVMFNNEEGWVHEDYVTELNPSPAQVVQQVVQFIKGEVNLGNSATTLAVRKIINNEFRGNTHLNCTEYVQYRSKTKLNINIQWPIKSGRDGGKWADIFQQYRLYKVLTEPQTNCAMCFTTGISANPITNATGHVAFVEEVLSDGSVRISEANWPPPGQTAKGQYSERTIPKGKWQDQYKAKFISFA